MSLKDYWDILLAGIIASTCAILFLVIVFFIIKSIDAEAANYILECIRSAAAVN